MIQQDNLFQKDKNVIPPCIFPVPEAVLLIYIWISVQYIGLCALTEAADELSEVYERVCVVVQQTEDAQGQVIGVCAAGPGEEQRKQHFELL